MYLRRCSMSSISEESETGDDDELPHNRPTTPKLDSDQRPLKFDVENCLGDLNSFKEVTLILPSSTTTKTANAYQINVALHSGNKTFASNELTQLVFG